MDAPAKTTAKKSKSMKPMVWSTVHDEMLCREILVVDPFTGTKKGTVARGTKWEEVAENLNKIQQVYFKVDKRAVRDRYNLLSKELRNKLKREEKESGIETDLTEVEMALEERIEKEDAAETEQRVVENQRKVKDSQDRENAESVRKKAMERLGQTQKRKADEGESEGKKKKKRSIGSDTLNFLREKNEQVQEMQKQELELKRQQLEVESKKQENFMQMMLNQQQQQQRQMQDFQAMMSVQTKQQNDLMLALVSRRGRYTTNFWTALRNSDEDCPLKAPVCSACPKENGRMFLSVDACFGLPRKKTSGASYRSPLSENMFFHKHKNVDSFMSAYPSSKTEPVVRTAAISMLGLKSSQREDLMPWMKQLFLGYAANMGFPLSS